LSVGSLPAEICGAYKRPSFCKSANIDRIEAEEISIPIFLKLSQTQLARLSPNKTPQRPSIFVLISRLTLNIGY